MCCTRVDANTGRKKVAKNRHLGTIAQLLRAISSQLRHVSTIGRNLLSSNTSSTCPYNTVNFGPLAAEIVLLVWGTPGNFNGFRVLAALLHGTVVVGVSQTLRHWTEGATYIRQGGHHVGHWPTFLVFNCNWYLDYILRLRMTTVLNAACPTPSVKSWKQLVHCSIDAFIECSVLYWSVVILNDKPIKESVNLQLFNDFISTALNFPQWLKSSLI